MEAPGRIANAEPKGRKGMRSEAPRRGRETGRRRGTGQDRMRVGTAPREARGAVAEPPGAHANAAAEVAALVAALAAHLRWSGAVGSPWVGTARGRPDRCPRCGTLAAPRCARRDAGAAVAVYECGGCGHDWWCSWDPGSRGVGM